MVRESKTETSTTEAFKWTLLAGPWDSKSFAFQPLLVVFSPLSAPNDLMKAIGAAKAVNLYPPGDVSASMN